MCLCCLWTRARARSLHILCIKWVTFIHAWFILTGDIRCSSVATLSGWHFSMYSELPFVTLALAAHEMPTRMFFFFLFLFLVYLLICDRRLYPHREVLVRERRWHCDENHRKHRPNQKNEKYPKQIWIYYHFVFFGLVFWTLFDSFPLYLLNYICPVYIGSCAIYLFVVWYFHFISCLLRHMMRNTIGFPFAVSQRIKVWWRKFPS